MAAPITTLFLDIGGVLLTNGWDRRARRLAADTFGLDYEELNERHHLTFDTYEVGKLSLDEYLRRVIFYADRPFSPEDFKEFLFAQSKSFPDMIELVGRLRVRHDLKTVVVSNEGRELTEYRIRNFGLERVVSVFISSCFVHFRKPDVDIYRIALDISQAAPAQVAYLDDRPLFVEVARNLGIHGIVHTTCEATTRELAALGLSL